MSKSRSTYIKVQCYLPVIIQQEDLNSFVSVSICIVSDHCLVLKSGVILEGDVGEVISHDCPTSQSGRSGFTQNIQKEYSKRLSHLFKITENGQNFSLLKFVGLPLEVTNSSCYGESIYIVVLINCSTASQERYGS